MKTVIPVLKSWLPLAATVTLICGIIYGTTQQTYRSNANDPQQQVAEDAVFALKNGVDPASLVSKTQEEISRSLKPFLLIYDDKGNPLASDAVLDGKVPSMPPGVLDFTRTNGSDVISWQPRSGVRSALVLLPFDGVMKGFVAAGRSLRIVEEREALLVKQIIFGWIFSVTALLVVVIASQLIFKPRTDQ